MQEIVAGGRVRSLPAAAAELEIGIDRLRWILRRRPEVAAQVPTLSGRRVVPDDTLELLRATVAAWDAGTRPGDASPR